MSNRVNKYLFDIKVAIEAINEFVANIDLEGFKQSRLIRSAVERQLEIVGESVKRIERTGAHRKRKTYHCFPKHSCSRIRKTWGRNSLGDCQKRCAQASWGNQSPFGKRPTAGIFIMISAFHTTHWSVVLTAKGGDTAAKAALQTLCETYYSPIHRYIQRHTSFKNGNEGRVATFYEGA